MSEASSRVPHVIRIAHFDVSKALSFRVCYPPTITAMSLPKIAIVGRPNVGKSSLLNRIARQRVSIVDPVPGVTRDRVSSIVELDAPLDSPKGTPPRLVEIVDTGGYGVYVAEGGRYDDVGADLTQLTPEIEGQIVAALSEAHLILMVVDAQSGATSLDDAIGALLRKHGVTDRVIAVANKVDNESWEAHAWDAARLGFGEPMCVSARTTYGMRRLMETLYNRTPDEPATAADTNQEMKLAIVGKRNAGKSALINALAGEPRVIVSEIAGTTRDAIDVRFEIEGRSMLAIDTAGVRKRKSFADGVEYYAYHRMLAAVQRADVALLIVDATVDVSHVDKKLADELLERDKPTVIVVNKWDLVQDKLAPADYEKYLTQELRGLPYAPIVFISATSGQGVRDAVAMAFNLFHQAGHHLSTSEVNGVIDEVMQRRGPSSRLGTQAKVYYAAQIGTFPPTIALVVNDPKLFRGHYERYLMNRLHDELPFSEVPIRLLFRKRKRIPLVELKQRGRAQRAGEGA